MSLLQRRLRAEWNRLNALVACNPGRLDRPEARDTVFSVRLHGPRVPHAASGAPVGVHDIRIDFPVHFPAVPMELYLEQPVQHPNIHPLTGFVCLWHTHRVSHTVEHALHKTAAMLSGTLVNLDPLHVMQPGVFVPQPDETVALQGVPHRLPTLPETPQSLSAPGRRSRLQ